MTMSLESPKLGTSNISMVDELFGFATPTIPDFWQVPNQQQHTCPPDGSEGAKPGTPRSTTSSSAPSTLDSVKAATTAVPGRTRRTRRNSAPIIQASPAPPPPAPIPDPVQNQRCNPLASTFGYFKPIAIKEPAVQAVVELDAQQPPCTEVPPPQPQAQPKPATVNILSRIEPSKRATRARKRRASAANLPSQSAGNGEDHEDRENETDQPSSTTLIPEFMPRSLSETLIMPPSNQRLAEYTRRRMIQQAYQHLEALVPPTYYERPSRANVLMGAVQYIIHLRRSVHDLEARMQKIQ